MANSTESKSNWDETKDKLKQKYAALTDKELIEQDELLGRLQVKLGISKEQILKIISQL